MLHDSSLQVFITNVDSYEPITILFFLSLSNIVFYTVVIIYLTFFYKKYFRLNDKSQLIGFVLFNNVHNYTHSYIKL